VLVARRSPERFWRGNKYFFCGSTESRPTEGCGCEDLCRQGDALRSRNPPGRITYALPLLVRPVLASVDINKRNYCAIDSVIGRVIRSDAKRVVVTFQVLHFPLKHVQRFDHAAQDIFQIGGGSVATGALRSGCAGGGCK